MWAAYKWIRLYVDANPHRCVPYQIVYKNAYYDFKVSEHVEL